MYIDLYKVLFTFIKKSVFDNIVIIRRNGCPCPPCIYCILHTHVKCRIVKCAQCIYETGACYESAYYTCTFAKSVLRFYVHAHYTTHYVTCIYIYNSFGTRKIFLLN